MWMFSKILEVIEQMFCGNLIWQVQNVQDFFVFVKCILYFRDVIIWFLDLVLVFFRGQLCSLGKVFNYGMFWNFKIDIQVYFLIFMVFRCFMGKKLNLIYNWDLNMD